MSSYSCKMDIGRDKVWRCLHSPWRVIYQHNNYIPLLQQKTNFLSLLVQLSSCLLSYSTSPFSLQAMSRCRHVLVLYVITVTEMQEDINYNWVWDLVLPLCMLLSEAESVSHNRCSHGRGSLHTLKSCESKERILTPTITTHLHYIHTCRSDVISVTHTNRHADIHTPLTKVACSSFNMLRCIGWCCVAVFLPALHPTHRVCLLFRGILHAHMCVGTQTCCHFPLLQAQLWFGSWYCLPFFYSHYIFACLICSMTSSPWRHILQSNRIAVHRICAGCLDVCLCVDVTNQWKQLHMCKWFHSSRNILGRSLVLSLSESVLCALGVCMGLCALMM